MTRIEVDAEKMVAGGDALGRAPDGRIAFVEGALPGERVLAEVTDARKDFIRARTIDVIAASDDRVAAPCPKVALGCGGCGWQHIASAAQRRLKEAVVRDALARVGGFAGDALPRVATVELPTGGYRTTARVAIRGGRAHFRRAHSPALVGAEACMVVDGAIRDLLDGAHFGSAAEAVVRVGTATGERAVWLLPSGSGARLPADVAVAEGRDRGRGVVHEDVRGRRFRVSIRSFFQSGPAAADAIAGAIVAALAGVGAGDRLTIADLYSGVGVFAGVIADATGARVVAVERDPSSAGDAAVNLRDVDAQIVRAEVGSWRPDGHLDAVVADPARPGLGRPGVAAAVAGRPRRIVLVSCDAASMARDARLLRDAGFALVSATLVDAFPHTPHIEVVAAFAHRKGGEETSHKEWL